MKCCGLPIRRQQSWFELSDSEWSIIRRRAVHLATTTIANATMNANVLLSAFGKNDHLFAIGLASYRADTPALARQPQDEEWSR